ncbi:MAG: HD domain-containing phosphohydrolase [Vicinamibacterales bacterium]
MTRRRATRGQDLDPLLLLKHLIALQRLTEMYPTGHPTIAEKLREAMEMVQPHLRSHQSVQIDIIHDDIFLNGTACSYARSATAPIVAALADVGVNSLHVEEGVQPDEFLGATECLAGRKALAEGETIERQLAERNVTHISLRKLVPLDTSWRMRHWNERPTGPMDPAHAEALAIAEGVFQEVAAGERINAIAVTDLVQLLIGQVAQSNAALSQILAVKDYENLTYCHSVNVAILSFILGRQLRLKEPAVAALVEAALLHDVGKTQVALDIVNKPGKLTESERKVVEEHPVRGAEILLETPGLQALTATVALEHHRTVIGTGYPDLGRGVVPHILSQVVSVADVYEALTGARSYRAPYPPEKACLILARSAGVQLNTTLVKAFVSAIGFLPRGTLVRTSQGELGVVIRTNPTDPLHPVVAVVDEGLNPAGGEIDTSVRDGSGGYERCIVETVPLDGRQIDLERLAS